MLSLKTTFESVINVVSYDRFNIYMSFLPDMGIFCFGEDPQPGAYWWT